jgi:ribose/xylose/arabinose/galactoside ABC-type transport system permease subunit
MTSTSDTHADVPASPRRQRWPVHKWALAVLERGGGVTLAVLIVGAVFAVRTNGAMLETANLLGIVRSLSSITIMGLGLLLVIIIGEIDLSFANLYGLCTNIVAVLWVTHGVPVYVAILAAFGAAILAGMFNAFFVAVIQIPAFIATLGSSAILFAMTLYIGHTQNLSPQFPPSGHTVSHSELSFFNGLAGLHLPHDFPMQGVWTAALLILVGFILKRTMFGFRLKAIGGNRNAADLARLPTKRYLFIVFIVCASMACVAGVLDFSFVGSVSPNDGQAYLFPVFASVVIGGASLSGGTGSALGTLMGALLLAVLANGFALEAAGAFAQQLLLGIVTIAAVVVDRYVHRRA